MIQSALYRRQLLDEKSVTTFTFTMADIYKQSREQEAVIEIIDCTQSIVATTSTCTSDTN